MSEQQKWISNLFEYDYKIQCKPGKDNSAVDALSRKDGNLILDALWVPQTSLWDNIRSTIQTHSYLQQIDKLAIDNPENPYSMRSNLIYFKNRIVIPPQSDIMQQLLSEFHNSPIGGHSGIYRTFQRLCQQFYWPSMYQSIMDYVTTCDICQKAKSYILSPARLLQPLLVPQQIWEKIAIDFIEGLPMSHDKNTILVVVDRLSKAIHFAELGHPYTAKLVAKKFVNTIVQLHGMLRSIDSNRDPIFISHFW